MPRDKIQAEVLAKLTKLQGEEKDPVWVSGTQLTLMFKKYNPSSVRMALVLLVDGGKVTRERRAGRGKAKATGQSAWYTVGEVKGEDSEG